MTIFDAEAKKEFAHKEIYIFGAHSRSQTLGVYLTNLHPEISIKAYLIDNDERNPKELEGVPVIDINEKCTLNAHLPVYVGTRSVFHREITEHLKKIGFSRIIPVTVDMDIKLRNQYVSQVFRSTGRKFKKMSEANVQPISACVYVAKSVFDKPTEQQAMLNDWEKYIQVGCDCTKKRLENAEVFDNTGRKNISRRNHQFCELTALYWIWENAKEDIVGLEHYRRHFKLEKSWLSKFKAEDIDVILPVPLYVHPSLAQNYRQRHTVQTWDAMMSVIRRNPEEYIKAADFFENTGCYSPCNMLIAKREVLDDLCKWMFPILFEVAGQIGELEDTYQNRYPGFLAERLMSFYFFLYEKDYRIAYSDKDFLQ